MLGEFVGTYLSIIGLKILPNDEQTRESRRVSVDLTQQNNKNHF
jgi:hypothetical protein